MTRNGRLRIKRLGLVLAASFLCTALMCADARAQPCCATFAPDSLPSLSPREVVNIGVNLTNTGDQVWLPSDVNWILSYVIVPAQGPAQWLAEGPANLFPTSVFKGQSTRLSVRLTAPNAPGNYLVRWFIGHHNGPNEPPPPPNPTYYFGDVTFDQSLTVIPSTLTPLQREKATVHPPEVVPVISKIFGRGGDVNVVTYSFQLVGQHFGANAIGAVRLSLQGYSSDAEITYWGETEVTGHFSVVAQPDQSAKLQLFRSDGLGSDEVDIAYVAGRDVAPFPVKLIAIDCASAWGTTDRCSVTGSQQDQLGGYHSSDCCITGDSGTDTYTLPALKNGWTYDGLYLKDTSYDGSVKQLDFVAGSSGPMTVRIDWSSPLHRYASYTFSVVVRGIRGIPMQ